MSFENCVHEKYEKILSGFRFSDDQPPLPIGGLVMINGLDREREKTAKRLRDIVYSGDFVVVTVTMKTETPHAYKAYVFRASDVSQTSTGKYRVKMKAIGVRVEGKTMAKCYGEPYCIENTKSRKPDAGVNVDVFHSTESMELQTFSDKPEYELRQEVFKFLMAHSGVLA